MPFTGEITRLQWVFICACCLMLAATGCGRGDDRTYFRGSTICASSKSVRV